MGIFVEGWIYGIPRSNQIYRGFEGNKRCGPKPIINRYAGRYYYQPQFWPIGITSPNLTLLAPLPFQLSSSFPFTGKTCRELKKSIGPNQPIPP